LSPQLSTANRIDCGIVDRPLLANCEQKIRNSPCAVGQGQLSCFLRRARSASRSKPLAKTVRGRPQGLRSESQRGRWTKAPPARRIFLVQRRTSPSRARPRLSGCGRGRRDRREAPCRKLREFVSAEPCIDRAGPLGCLLRRARSASRSKPLAKTVRGRPQGLRSESQRGRWTKAPPARRISLVQTGLNLT